jgi:hypothetical protein
MTRPTAIGHQVFSLFPLIVSCVFCRFGTRIVRERLRESEQTGARLMYYHSGCAQPQSPYSAAQVAWAQAHAGQAHVYGPPTPPHNV